jgi:GTP cyclohydrolase I
MNSVDPRVKLSELERICRELLCVIGEDIERPGLADTPSRFARSWLEFIDYDPGNIETTFETVHTDQMVVVSGIRVWSMCEHHLLPFHCDVSIGYITGGKVLGLSKFARVAQQAAHRLQIQEGLVHNIADEIVRLTGSDDVAVMGSGQHLCMVMRGAKAPATMKTSVMRGQFLESAPARAEFLEMIR